jgi:hypothetical protein
MGHYSRLVEGVLSVQQRRDLPSKTFAIHNAKGEGKLPLNNPAHIHAAMGRINQVKGISSTQRATAAAKIARAARTHNINASGFKEKQVLPKQRKLRKK